MLDGLTTYRVEVSFSLVKRCLVLQQRRGLAPPAPARPCSRTKRRGCTGEAQYAPEIKRRLPLLVHQAKRSHGWGKNAQYALEVERRLPLVARGWVSGANDVLNHAVEGLPLQDLLGKTFIS
jgi:hypothetical protein